MRVEAHLHIRRFLAGDEACISVRPLPKGKVNYSGSLTLRNVTFAVQPAGQAKFRATNQKNVHAFVRGELVGDSPFQRMPREPQLWRMARYNPANTDTFVDAQTGQPVTVAQAALLVGNKVFYF